MDLNHVDEVTGRKWDLSLQEDQDKAIRMIKKDKPMVVGLSPECTLFSILQNLRKTPINAEAWEKAIECVKFAVRVAEVQMAGGRFFYFEHPLSATSWRVVEELVRLRETEGVESVVVHMCQFGLTASDGDGPGLAKKPTRILTNMKCLAEMINRKCQGGHRHVNLMDGKAKAAATYTEAFCDGILDGIEMYSKWINSEVDMIEELENELFNIGEDMCDPEETTIPFTFSEDGYCIDDVRGGELPLEWVKEARRGEMNGFSERKVYVVRPRRECTEKGVKPIGVRWVDARKNEGVRSRLVCMDSNRKKGKKDR